MTGPGFGTKTVDDAAGILQKMKSWGFIAVFAIAEKMLGFTQQLSLQLQGATKDLHFAHLNVANVRQALTEAQNDNKLYDGLWVTITNMAGSEIESPRMAKRKPSERTTLLKVAKSIITVHYYLPYLDHLTSDLAVKFATATIITDVFLLQPSMIIFSEQAIYCRKVTCFAMKYEDDLPSFPTLEEEI